MSAEEAAATTVAEDGGAASKSGRDLVALIRPYLVYAPGVVLLASLGVGYVYGPALAILTLAVCSLALAIAMLWESLRAAFGETALTPEEAFSIGAPSAEEEQKRAVLRAIKDLDFEHAVGKISDEDYRRYRARYRREAKRLLRLIDEQAAPERIKVEALVGRRLVAAGLADPDPRWEQESGEQENEPDKKKGKKRRKKKRKKKKEQPSARSSKAAATTAEDEELPSDATAQSNEESEAERLAEAGQLDEMDPAADSEPSDAQPEAEPSSPTEQEDHAEATQASNLCPACGTANDEDAVFCKRCGQSLADEEQEA